jgi:hypothetical protein
MASRLLRLRHGASLHHLHRRGRDAITITGWAALAVPHGGCRSIKEGPLMAVPARQ